VTATASVGKTQQPLATAKPEARLTGSTATVQTFATMPALIHRDTQDAL
jgi:hypothetical protein